MTDKTIGWTVRIIGVLAVILFLWSIQWFLPDFYSTMWRLTVEGDLDGLTDYIASFGYSAILVSVFMIVFANALAIPSIPFLTVNGVIFGLVPGIIISWIGEVLGIEVSFRLTRTLLRNQAKKVIQRSNKLEKLDSYSCIRTGTGYPVFSQCSSDGVQCFEPYFLQGSFYCQCHWKNSGGRCRSVVWPRFTAD